MSIVNSNRDTRIAKHSGLENKCIKIQETAERTLVCGY